mgnify:CR=1 FL=1|nr:MAG TPA: hypothetical protein [Caudoviricetes sp.]
MNSEIPKGGGFSFSVQRHQLPRNAVLETTPKRSAVQNHLCRIFFYEVRR